MNEDEYLEKSVQFAKGTIELAFRMGYVTREEEIVRCRGCKYYAGGTSCFSENGMFEASEDGYCSWAEREE